MRRNYKNLINNSKKFLLLVLSVICYLLSATTAQAITLYSGAANQNVFVDHTFLVEGYLDTQDQEVNTLSLKLNFSNENLEVIEATPGNSGLNLWIKTPTFSNEKGTIELIGGVTGGVNTKKLPIFRAVFKPIAEGEAKIVMDETSTLLLSDGVGTEEKLTFNQLKFEIHPADLAPIEIISPTHPNPDHWYKQNKVLIEFLPKPNTEYSYGFSSNLEVFPDDVQDAVEDVIYEDLPDGIYYFKLNSKTVGPVPWEEAAVFRVQIDTTPPQEFQPYLAADPSIFAGKPFISFNTRDNISGVDHYEVKFGGWGRWEKTADSVLQVPGFILGQTISIKVVDAAGNEQISTINLNELPNQGFFQKYILWVIIIMACILAVFGYLLYRFLRKKYAI